jgi:hypothetical protein
MCFLFFQSSSQRDSVRSEEMLQVYVVPTRARSAKAEVREAKYRELIEHTCVVSTLVSAIADGPLNIPVLKNAAELTKKIAEAGQVSTFESDEADMCFRGDL